jgi:hypothetical protein
MVEAPLAQKGSGKIDDFGTVRGRFGYAFDNLLLYGTGGFAWANETVTDTETCNGIKCPTKSSVFAFNSASSSATPDGWAAGGGLEWRFLPNWTLRVEYLHLQFNGISNTFNLNGTVIVKGARASLHRKRNYLRTNCPSRAACSPLQTRHAISQIDGLLARCSFDDLVKRKQFEQRESGTEFGCIWSFAGRAVPPGSGTNDTGALTSIKIDRRHRLLYVMCT